METVGSRERLGVETAKSRSNVVDDALAAYVWLLFSQSPDVYYVLDALFSAHTALTAEGVTAAMANRIGPGRLAIALDRLVRASIVDKIVVPPPDTQSSARRSRGARAKYAWFVNYQKAISTALATLQDAQATFLEEKGEHEQLPSLVVNIYSRLQHAESMPPPFFPCDGHV